MVWNLLRRLGNCLMDDAVYRGGVAKKPFSGRDDNRPHCERNEQCDQKEFQPSRHAKRLGVAPRWVTVRQRTWIIYI